MEVVKWKPDLILDSIPLFCDLSEGQLARLIEDASLSIASEGELIFDEGDVGEFVYIILQGTVQIYITADDGFRITLTNLGKGDYFGEQAILPESSGLRTASAMAMDAVRMLRISKATFQVCLIQDKQFHQALRDIGAEQLQYRLAQESALFRSIKLGENGENWLTEKRFITGEVVFREGDPGDDFYLILMGNAVATKLMNGKNEIASFLGPGQYFGELALINQQPRSATITAKTELLTLAFSGEKFLSLYAESPELRTQLENLSGIYQLQSGGFLTLHTSSLLDMNSTTALFHDPSDVKLALTKVVGKQVCSVIRVSEQPYQHVTRITYEEHEQKVFREILLSNGMIVGATCHGYWEDLAYVLSIILKGNTLEPWQLALFRYGGELRTSCGLSPDEASNIRVQGDDALEDNDPIDSLIMASMGKTDNRLKDLADVISIWDS